MGMQTSRASTNAESFTVDGHKGGSLAATLYSPDQPGPTGTVIINSGVGVRQRFYSKFAEFLRSEGFRVVTYDYRGIGDSQDGSLRQLSVSIHDWGSQDFPSVVDAVAARFPDEKILLVGHSFGGQILGLARNHGQISAMMSVATQSGYWGHWPAPRRYMLAGLWYLLLPSLTAICSYFPAKRLGIGEDLPAGVARQWARWCRAPGYLLKDVEAHTSNRFKDFTGPIFSLSFDDDNLAPERAVSAIHELYSGAAVERRHVRAQESPPGRIGHFGFFRLSPEHELWEDSLAWLKSV